MSLLLIGATGFLGKSLLETLLRNEYQGDIYLLIRSKKGIDSHARFKQLLNNICLSKIDNLISRNIFVIDGDLNSSCGLSNNHKFDIIINCAASISFTLPLKEALSANVSIINNLKYIAKATECNRLIHVSTAFVNFPSVNNSKSPEELVDLKLNAFDFDNCTDMYSAILNDQIDFHTIQMVTGYPNTYTFTKSLAEHILMNDDDFPASKCYIVRPSAIMGAYQYPIPGWTEGFGAGNGYYALFMSRSVSIMNVFPDTPKQVNFVPVDLVSKQIYSVVKYENNKHINHAVTTYESVENIPYAIDYLRRVNSLFYDSQYYFYIVIKNNFLYELFIQMFDVSYLYFQLFFVITLAFFFPNKYESKKKLLKFVIKNVSLLGENYNHFLNTKYEFEITNKEYLDNFDMSTYVPIFTHGINEFLLKRKPTMNILNKNISLFSYFSKIFLQIYFGIFYFTSFFSPVFRFVLRHCYSDIQIKYTDMNSIMQLNNTKYVIVANHRSHMDSIIIKYFLDSTPGMMIKNPYILATKQLFDMPILSWLVRVTGIIPIDRENSDKKILTESIENVLNQGNNLLFYPEGTRSRNNQIGPFKKGVFSIIHNYAETNNIVVVPISISYQMFPEYNSFKASFQNTQGSDNYKPFSLRRTLRWIFKILKYGENYGTVKLVVGSPVDFSKQNLEESVNLVESQIRSNYVVQPIALKNPDDIDHLLWYPKKMD